MSDLDGRKLGDLRVVDLRAELEKRGLDKSGNKQVLLERLKEALTEENIDSESHTFHTETGDDDKLVISHNGDEPKGEEDGEGSGDNDNVVNADIPTLDFENDDEKRTKDEEEEDSATATKDTKTEENPPNPAASEETTEGKVDNSDDAAKIEDSTKKTTEENAGDETSDETNKEESEEKQDTEKQNVTSDADQPKVAKSSGAKETDEKEVKAEAKDNQSNASPDKSASKAALTTTRNQLKERFMNEQNRNLWITNISQTTRATELKQALSEHGKVIGAKVVINARHPAACCYGYVKMDTVEDAENCIAKLNNTELNGQIIRIEKVRPDHLYPLKQKLDACEKAKLAAKQQQNNSTSASSTSKPEGKDEKKPETQKDVASKDDKKLERKGDKTPEKREKTEEKRTHSQGRSEPRSRSRGRKSSSERHQRSTSRGQTTRRGSLTATRPREREMLTFDKIKDERERERARERERIMRDRRREEAARQREFERNERNQRNESMRLEREREKLRRERERLEKEKAEFMQFERERQKLEREKLELERIELERAKMRIEEERRAAKRPAPSNYRDRERSYEDRKRVASERHFDEAPPPPRFEAPSSLKARDPSPPIKKFSSSASPNKEYGKGRIGYDKSFTPKRDYEERSHPSSMSRAPPIPKYDSSTSNRERDIRDPRVRDSSTMSSMSTSKYPADTKISRYSERERSPHFRSVREDRDRRPISDGKWEIRNTRGEHRYPDASKDSVRYDRSSSDSRWNQKVFAPPGSQSTKQWTKDSWRTENSGSSWNSSSVARSSGGMSSSAFGSNSSVAMEPSCPPPPGINNYVNDRFEYKGNMSSMRKY